MYDIAAPGYKYNLTDVAAAMGLVQLSRVEEMTKRRFEIAQAYTAAFGSIDTLECPTVPDKVETAWHLYILRLNLDHPGVTGPDIDRDGFIRRLNHAGIGTSVHFIPLHLHSYYVSEYGYVPDDFPLASKEFRRAVSLPIYSAMSDTDVDRVIDAVREIAARPGRQAGPA